MKFDFGDAVEKLSGKIKSLAKKDLHKLMKDTLVTAAAYLVKELPIKVQVIFDAKFLNDQEWNQNGRKVNRRRKFGVRKAA